MNFEAQIGDKTHLIKVHEEDGACVVTIDDGKPILADLVSTSRGYHLILGDRSYNLALASDNSNYEIQLEGKLYDFNLISEYKKLQKTLRGQELSGAGTIVAKMPGKIIKILANEGEEVHDGQGVLIMEAMKMENELRTPSKGIVKEIRVKEGETVDAGAILVVLE
ncbi:biotin/lipoyl-containing protein [Bdellovibrionota bacterium]